MDSASISIEKAMSMLKISEEDREKYIELLEKQYDHSHQIVVLDVFLDMPDDVFLCNTVAGDRVLVMLWRRGTNPMRNMMRLVNGC